MQQKFYSRFLNGRQNVFLPVFVHTVIFLSFQRDRPGQTVQTQIRLLLIRVYTVCNSLCIFWIFRVITTILFAVQIFRKFTVLSLLCAAKVMKIPLTSRKVDVTVNFLNIRTPQKFVVITLKFELCGSIIE